MRRLFSYRDARRYLAGQTLSLFGDTAMWLALGIWVKSLTGSSADAGLIFFVLALPRLFSPAAGLWVDRVRRRPLLVGANLVAAGIVLPLLFVHGRRDLWLIYLVTFLYGAVGTVLDSAQSALFTVMLPQDLLADANGALSTARETLRLIGPLAGAGLFAWRGGGFVAVVDAVTFLGAAFATASLSTAEQPAPPPEHHWRTEVVAGLRHLFSDVRLRQLTVTCGLMLLFVGFTETAVFSVVQHGLHRPPSFVGVIISIQGVGALVGGPTAAPLSRRIGNGPLVAAGLLVGGLGALSVATGAWAGVVPGVVLFGVAIPWIVVGLMTSVQVLTPAQLQGRVAAGADTALTLPQTISIAVGAALIGVLGYHLEMTLVGLALLAAGGYLLTRREQRAGFQPPVPPPVPAPREVPAGSSLMSD
jgi:MFS family permease